MRYEEFPNLRGGSEDVVVKLIKSSCTNAIFEHYGVWIFESERLVSAIDLGIREVLRFFKSKSAMLVSSYFVKRNDRGDIEVSVYLGFQKNLQNLDFLLVPDGQMAVERRVVA